MVKEPVLLLNLEKYGVRLFSQMWLCFLHGLVHFRGGLKVTEWEVSVGGVLDW